MSQTWIRVWGACCESDMCIGYNELDVQIRGCSFALVHGMIGFGLFSFVFVHGVICFGLCSFGCFWNHEFIHQCHSNWDQWRWFVAVLAEAPIQYSKSASRDYGVLGHGSFGV